MRRFALAVTAAAAASCAWVAPLIAPTPNPHVLLISRQVLDNLSLLFYAFGGDGGPRGEYIVCLEGEIRGDTLDINDFRMPHMTRSTPMSASMHPEGTCKQYDTVIGWLHNHPTHFGEKPLSSCYLSRVDVSTWLNYSDLPVAFVQCGQHSFAWWFRGQVDNPFLQWPLASQRFNEPFPTGTQEGSP